MSRDHAYTQPPGRIARGLGTMTVAVTRRPCCVLVVGLILAIASLILAATSLEYRTQRGDLMRADRDVQLRWNAYVDEFGPDEDMVVAVEGDNPTQMIQAIEQIAERLRQQPDHFDRLFYKVDLSTTADRALLYLEPDQLDDLIEQLDHMDLLLGPLAPFAWRSLTLENMLLRAEWCARQLEAGQELPEADRQLLVQLKLIAESAAATLRHPENYVDPWQGLVPGSPGDVGNLDGSTYFFSHDQTLAFLLVRPTQSDGSFTPAKESVSRLRTLIDETAAEFPDLEFGLTGLPVLEHDEMAASQSDSNKAGLIALIGVAMLYGIAYRRRRYPLLTIATLLTGSIWALGWLTLTVGHLNILSTAFAVMLIGMGDYGVLWVARYTAERPSSADPVEALRRTAEHVGPGILTAALTTALAFFATMLADFRAVTELGWIAGWGVLLCALSCFTMMPALIVLCDRRLVTGDVRESIPFAESHSAARAWLPGLTARPGWVTGIAGCLVVMFAFGAGKTQYDHNLLNLQDDCLASVDWELRLIERTSGANWNAVSIADTPEEAKARAREFEALPEVSAVVEVASLVPSDQEEKLPFLREIRRRLRGLPEPSKIGAHPRPNPTKLSDSLGRLVIDLEHLSADRVPDGLLPALKRLRNEINRTPLARCVNRLSDFENRLSLDLAHSLARLRDSSRPEPITLENLPPELRERYISPNGKWLVRAFARESLWEYQAIQEFVEATRQVDPDATGKPFGTLEGLNLMKSGFQWAGVYALMAIVIVLALDFRRLGDVFLALLPLAIGGVCCIGLLALLGVAVNPANLIALPLIVGVGVDHGVHVVHDFRTRRTDRPFCLSHSTGRGILIAALTTMVGFGALMLASHRGLAGLGLALTLGVGCCLVAALVVLPAVLRLVGNVKPSQHHETISPERRAAA